MRGMILMTAVAALALVSCGPRQLTLPGDPIDRAATCAVVSAADSRQHAPIGKGDLGFSAQTRILHYAMLAGSEDNGFSTGKASAVVTRMSELEADITKGKWQDLVVPCDSAYPEVKKTAGIELPKARFEAQLGCYALGDFLVKTVTTSDPGAQDQMSQLMEMRRKLDSSIGNGLKARDASKYEKTLELKQAALVRMTRLGAPAEVVKMCTKRFV